jgi:hypothetical protein
MAIHDSTPCSALTLYALAIAIFTTFRTPRYSVALHRIVVCLPASSFARLLLDRGLLRLLAHAP